MKNGNISDNFTLYEVVKSYQAIRLGINNVLPEEFIGNAKAYADNILEPTRRHYGIPFSPKSWYRCPELNTAVNGKPTSDHLYARAADVEISSINNLDLAIWQSENVDFDQIILENYIYGIPDSGWVHSSYRGKENRKQLLTWDKPNNIYIIVKTFRGLA